jgi:hypothetical protein
MVSHPRQTLTIKYLQIAQKIGASCDVLAAYYTFGAGQQLPTCAGWKLQLGALSPRNIQWADPLLTL